MSRGRLPKMDLKSAYDLEHSISTSCRIQHDLWPLDEIDPKKAKFPCCLVWIPLPVVSWLAPFIGHVGICREDGAILDFSGSNFVNLNQFSYGAPARYLQLDREKIEQLAKMIQESKHLVVFTGAEISTSCGIPDFRGPKGIWTLQRYGKPLPEASLPFHRAMPGMTHMALVELEKAGILKFVISQNVDGLHIPREKLAELHGNSFLEICPTCGTEYLRDFEVETIGLKQTSRRCSKKKCGGKLRDTALDWEDALPPKEMNPAEDDCRTADVVLCLGTSLQITPACNLPLKCLRDGGKIVIVNLQKTPKDKKAALVIHGLVDKVIAGVMESLNLRIPPYIRIDRFQTILSQSLSADEKYVNWNIRVASVHGLNAPLPFHWPRVLNFDDSFVVYALGYLLWQSKVQRRFTR